MPQMLSIELNLNWTRNISLELNVIRCSQLCQKYKGDHLCSTSHRASLSFTFFLTLPVLHFLCPGFQASFFVGVQSSHTREKWRVKERQQRDADRASTTLCPRALDPSTPQRPESTALWLHTVRTQRSCFVNCDSTNCALFGRWIHGG